MKRNLLLIAAAGAGKTTYIVREALKSEEKVLITTFTTENEAEIKKKIIKEKGFIPENIVVQTWFSFLLEHGVRPYQGCVDDRMFDYEVKGLLLVTKKSGIKYTFQGKSVPYSEDEEFFEHYFTREHKIYSDKIAKFVCRACERSNDAVIQRLEKIYSTIYIDEVQDLAGYDLDLVRILMASSSNIILVGDPRQVTYYTHWETKNSSFRNGKIELFLNQCPKKLKIEIDKEILNKSHRNNKAICDFSSLLYQGEFPKTEPCSCSECHPVDIEHQGIFLVKEDDISAYLEKYDAIQLIWNRKNKMFLKDKSFYNMGISKGKSFDRVLIYPTKDMITWLANTSTRLKDETRAKLYVAITRARYSVAFVVNQEEIRNITTIPVWDA
ncbi:MAG: UvrD-helicase domain-containing protein [Bacteroidales bacterium]|nr:UvrD-helicase domain-containing protein [Bacteroidales bacterium]